MGKLFVITKNLFGKKIANSLLDCKDSFIIRYKNKGMIYKLIKTNNKYKDSHKGERCYILGNGPSLLNVDLKQLSNEFVFSTNYFNMVPKYEEAKTNIHLWMDLNTFDMRPEVKENPELVKRGFVDIARQKPICFVPVEAYEYIKRNQLEKKLKINYLFASKSIVECDIKRIDLTKGIFSCTTVVQYAIQIAIYLGFKEIVLLGCDSTNIISQLNTILGKSGTGLHAYDIKRDGAEDATVELLNTWNTNDFLMDQYMLFKGYEILYDYCNKIGVKIINCSEPTLLTEIPKCKINSIIK